MVYFRRAVLLLLAMSWSISSSAHTSQPTASAENPEQTVRSLNREVLAHAPSGLLDGPNTRIFSPYLSRSLLQKMRTAGACGQDWFRQNKGQMVKAPFAWSEAGMFTGANERTYPGSFRIESTRAGKDGSFLVLVSFAYRPADGPGTWSVVDTLVREGGQFVLNEVTFPKERADKADWTLSQMLSEGCAGTAWVGSR